MSSREDFAENPFLILGLDPRCTRAEIEREGRKLLDMLKLGLANSQSYETPLGPRERDAESVRRAMSELRDPDKRLIHELWGRARTIALPPESATPEPWSEALRALGWVS